MTNSPPTLTGVGHQRTVSTDIGCNQWLSLAKPPLKVGLAGRNRSLVARTSKWWVCYKKMQDCGGAFNDLERFTCNGLLNASIFMIPLYTEGA